MKDRNASTIVQTFIDAEDALTKANRDLLNAKEDLIKDLVHQGRFDMFDLNIRRVYRKYGIPPKGQR